MRTVAQMTAEFSSYYRTRDVAAEVNRGHHRDQIGGMWDEIGGLQFELLKAQGLRPNHRLLDIGCGCLRGGIHFVAYLESGNYFGLDLNESLLDAGYNTELAEAALQERLPRSNLIADGNFAFGRFGAVFDRAIAFSLFTHLPLNAVRVCLERLAEVMSPGGVFHATFFEVPDGVPSFADVTHEPAGVVTHGSADPYHYRLADFIHAAAGLPWDVEYIGWIGHPRGQRLVNFIRRANQREQAPLDTRSLSVRSASTLEAGADHYRAYVGPPDRFDFMSATQFALLFQLGLRDHHRVLDFGCGSLRVGRLLIPFLQRGRYFGIDPNRWLIEEGLRHELGPSAVGLKMPRFAYNDDFECTVFGETFDFIIAQSIVTHTGPDLAQRLFSSSARALEPGGVLLFSYIRNETEDKVPLAGWHYPGCVSYSHASITGMLSDAGLVNSALPWYHPAAAWHAAAASADALPAFDELPLLRGIVLRSGQFVDSRSNVGRFRNEGPSEASR